MTAVLHAIGATPNHCGHGRYQIMPYKASQCRAFGAKSRRGEKVPDDWKEHCRGQKQGSKKAKRKTAVRKK
jgi:hypothetical protein